MRRGGKGIDGVTSRRFLPKISDTSAVTKTIHLTAGWRREKPCGQVGLLGAEFKKRGKGGWSLTTV